MFTQIFFVSVRSRLLGFYRYRIQNSDTFHLHYGFVNNFIAQRHKLAARWGSEMLMRFLKKCFLLLTKRFVLNECRHSLRFLLCNLNIFFEYFQFGFISFIFSYFFYFCLFGTFSQKILQYIFPAAKKPANFTPTTFMINLIPQCFPLRLHLSLDS